MATEPEQPEGCVVEFRLPPSLGKTLNIWSPPEKVVGIDTPVLRLQYWIRQCEVVVERELQTLFRLLGHPVTASETRRFGPYKMMTPVHQKTPLVMFKYFDTTKGIETVAHLPQNNVPDPNFIITLVVGEA